LGGIGFSLRWRHSQAEPLESGHDHGFKLSVVEGSGLEVCDSMRTGQLAAGLGWVVCIVGDLEERARGYIQDREEIGDVVELELDLAGQDSTDRSGTQAEISFKVSRLDLSQDDQRLEKLQYPSILGSWHERSLSQRARAAQRLDEVPRQDRGWRHPNRWLSQAHAEADEDP